MDMNKLRQNEEYVRLLVIEDDPDDVLLLYDMLNESVSVHFEAMDANRLQAGLDIIRQKEIDIILTDLWLPDSMGLSTLQKIFPYSATRIPLRSSMSRCSASVQTLWRMI